MNIFGDNTDVYPKVSVIQDVAKNLALALSQSALRDSSLNREPLSMCPTGNDDTIASERLSELTDTSFSKNDYVLYATNRLFLYSNVILLL